MTDSTQSNSAEMPDGDMIPEAHRISHRKLREVISGMFNLDDFRLFCYDLSVNFDDLGGPSDPLSVRISKLIEHFHRRQRLRVLLVTLRENRPAITWEHLLLDPNEQDDAPSTVPPAISQPPSSASDTFIANRSFMALFRLLRLPETREAVISFQTDFEAASGQIDLMNDYKILHDLFQELENRYFLIENDRKRLPEDDLAWDSLALNEPELNTKIGDLIAIARQAAFAQEAERWVIQLEKIREDMQTAVENFNLDILTKATRLLYRILNRLPSRINAQLMATANALRLDNLEKAITVICDNIDASEFGAEFEVVIQIKEGAGALSGIDKNLNQLTTEHDAWQDIDDELRRVESTLDSGIEELEDAWFDLEPMARQLINGHTEDWATSIDTVIIALGDAINDGMAVKIRRLFRRFRSQTGRRFRQVDLELLGLCHNLQKVGESLDLLLRTVK
jgi:Effector-associated domain 7